MNLRFHTFIYLQIIFYRMTSKPTRQRIPVRRLLEEESLDSERASGARGVTRGRARGRGDGRGNGRGNGRGRGRDSETSTVRPTTGEDGRDDEGGDDQERGRGRTREKRGRGRGRGRGGEHAPVRGQRGNQTTKEDGVEHGKEKMAEHEGANDEEENADGLESHQSIER